MLRAEEQRQQLIDDMHQLYPKSTQQHQGRYLGTLTPQQPTRPEQSTGMAHCFQVERVLDAVAEPVAVRDCISGEECYGAVQILEEKSNPFESSAVENLTSLLLQWQISGEYTSDSFDNEVGSKMMELLQLYDVTTWRSTIAAQCKRAADWCLVSPD